MPRNYKHLSIEERATLEVMLKQGCKLRAIARSLQRAPSTLSRELARNGYVKPTLPRPVGRPATCGGYRSVLAQARARGLVRKPRVPRKLVVGSALWGRISGGLRSGLSPEQISGLLSRHMSQPEKISHETIYSAIYAMPRGALRTEVIAMLRMSHKSRRPRARGLDRRGQICDLVSIEERPTEVLERLVPGHWEGDLIKGKGNRSQVGTLVERSTLFTVLAYMPSAKAACAAK